MQAMRLLSLLLATFGVLAQAQAPTSAPTAAPTEAPTSAPTAAEEDKTPTNTSNTTTQEPSSNSSNTTSSTTTKAPVTNSSTTTKAPVANSSTTTVAAAVPQTKITFALTLQTNATCPDMADGTALYRSMQEAGGRLAGGVKADSVKVLCGTARRLLGGRRLASLKLDFEVMVPSTEAAAAQSSLADMDLATMVGIFETAVAGSNFSATVPPEALQAMKGSVVTEVIATPGANNTNATTTKSEEVETSGAAAQQTMVALIAAMMLLVSV
eukprot:TRINITY_DN4830_c0_g1_i2.p1 TRINITY_DN4830_c0_g1~~TRINITY_DN4830_c0_g1_i2.p1  ORF type:complete len:269 (+),score=72.66 TRINITY_DN4830_c0_g1_i2:76-882(+)